MPTKEICAFLPFYDTTGTTSETGADYTRIYFADGTTEIRKEPIQKFIHSFLHSQGYSLPLLQEQANIHLHYKTHSPLALSPSCCYIAVKVRQRYGKHDKAYGYVALHAIKSHKCPGITLQNNIHLDLLSNNDYIQEKIRDAHNLINHLIVKRFKLHSLFHEILKI